MTRLRFSWESVSPRLLVSPTDSLYVPCDFLVLKDDNSSVKVANFNDPSMCVYAAILNLASVRAGSNYVIVIDYSKIV